MADKKELLKNILFRNVDDLANSKIKEARYNNMTWMPKTAQK